jgi:hypothetical protein
VRIRLKCSKSTDNDGCQVMTIPHMTLWVMWAKNQMCALIENSTASSELNIQYVDRHLLVKMNMHEIT